MCDAGGRHAPLLPGQPDKQPQCGHGADADAAGPHAAARRRQPAQPPPRQPPPHGPVMTLKLGLTTAIVVSSRDVARGVFTRHDPRLAARAMDGAAGEMDGGGGGDGWVRERREVGRG
ncbi:hypothetical protein ZWY2020_030220 [Hordeum vulgare]|nr:hypothetical protein ZWY2020_030220 [Hordeum vulgare]